MGGGAVSEAADVRTLLTHLADACYLSDRDLMPAAFIDECERYGVILVAHCAICHAETPDAEGNPAHESWCGILDDWRAGDRYDAARDADKERDDVSTVMWEGEDEGFFPEGEDS